MSIDLAVVFRQAADIIRANGHHQGSYFTRPESGATVAPPSCPVCIAGAVAIALTGWPVPGGLADGDYDLFEEVASALVALMGLKGDPLLDPVGRLAVWNDIAGRTAADVILALETAALKCSPKAVAA
ncbi:DUF6197 family protein [Streptomyces lasiicapitis]|uniref:DUF6197 family protein n=1 Tax=Streptomyces lasiicapitis TaxID=1923961 RepID=UPI003687EB4B